MAKMPDNAVAIHRAPNVCPRCGDTLGGRAHMCNTSPTQDGKGGGTLKDTDNDGD